MRANQSHARTNYLKLRFKFIKLDLVVVKKFELIYTPIAN